MRKSLSVLLVAINTGVYTEVVGYIYDCGILVRESLIAPATTVKIKSLA